MDNKTINEIAAQIAQNYETAEVPMYGQRLCLPDRASVIAILELLQKLLFPACRSSLTVLLMLSIICIPSPQKNLRFTVYLGLSLRSYVSRPGAHISSH